MKEQRAKDYHRTVQFKTGSDGWSTLLPTWRNEWDLPAKPPKGWDPVSEIYVKMTLDELRAIDGDHDAQSQFVNRKLKPTEGAYGLPVLRLCIRKGQSITDDDIRYLCCLFPPPPYLVATVPLLFHYENKTNERGKPAPNLRERDLEPVSADFQIAFAERFIAAAGPSYKRELALTVPPNFTPNDVPRLLKAYRDYGAPLAVIDAFGNATYDSYLLVRSLKGIGAKGKTYSLLELFGENHAFYAFDSKPYVGMRGDVAASHLVQLMGGYSSFGPRYTTRTMIKPVPTGQRPPPAKPTRVLVPNEIAYCRASSPTATGPISAWAAKVAPGFREPWTDYDLRRRFAAEGGVRVAISVNAWSAENRLSASLDKRRVIAKELAMVRKMNRRLLDPTPSGRQTTL